MSFGTEYLGIQPTYVPVLDDLMPTLIETDQWALIYLLFPETQPAPTGAVISPWRKCTAPADNRLCEDDGL